MAGLPPLEDGQAANILPVGRNVELPVNSLVAFGRRPTSSGSLKNSTGPNIFTSFLGRVANAVEHNPLGWQASKASLKERIEFMYCNELMADVFFFVGKDEHRQVRPFG